MNDPIIYCDITTEYTKRIRIKDLVSYVKKSLENQELQKQYAVLLYFKLKYYFSIYILNLIVAVKARTNTTMGKWNETRK